MRYFTLDEANRALVLVRPVISDILEKRRRLVTIDRTRKGMRAKPAGATHLRVQRTEHEFRALIDKLEYHIDEIAQIGCALKDVSQGIIDFPSWYRGREICLCWQVGEKEVQFWHEIHTGFQSRLQVDDSFRPVTQALAHI